MTIAKGFNGSVEFDGARVLLQRKGAGRVSLPVASINSVEFKRGGLTVGYVKFHTGAVVDNRKVRNKTQALLLDPHAVTLQFTSNKAFEVLVSEVEAAVFAAQ